MDNTYRSIELYKKDIFKKRIIILLLFTCSILLAIISLCSGFSDISLLEAPGALLGFSQEQNSVRILQKIRLPRVLAAFVAGSGLSVSGCIMQNILKNPMASPSTLGVSNGAVFGANVAIIVLGAGTLRFPHGSSIIINNPYIVTICAFVFALITILITVFLSGLRNFSVENIVLCGVALGSVFSAGTTILQYFAMDTQVAYAVFWTFGDLGRASFTEIGIMAFVVLVSYVYFHSAIKDFSCLADGQEAARSLGVNTTVLRFVSLVLASLICAVHVSYLGIIGFVGLIAPHAAGIFVGNNFKYLLPASALCGSILLLFADIVSRTMLKGVSLPVGAITSLFGGPAFLYILFRGKRRRSL